MNCLKSEANNIAVALGRLKKKIRAKWKQQLKTWQKRKRKTFFRSYRDKKMNYTRIMISMKGPFNTILILLGCYKWGYCCNLFILQTIYFFRQNQCASSLPNNKGRDLHAWFWLKLLIFVNAPNSVVVCKIGGNLMTIKSKFCSVKKFLHLFSTFFYMFCNTWTIIALNLYQTMTGRKQFGILNFYCIFGIFGMRGVLWTKKKKNALKYIFLP